MRAKRSGRSLRGESLEARQLLAADVLITEFLADNEISLRDETGHREDWIELYNAGDQTASLSGWYLTDDAAELTKWRLPRITIDPQQYLVVFASNRDQAKSGQPLHTNFKLSVDGEYLALVEPDGRTVASEFGPQFRVQVADVSYGFSQTSESVQFVSDHAAGTRMDPHEQQRAPDLGTEWTNVGYDDSFWQAGTNGLGYENRRGYETLIGLDVKGSMYDVSTTAYMRLPFDVDARQGLSTLKLRMRYDDGFAAYLNGTLVATRNAPDTLTWQSGALSDRADAQAVIAEEFDLTGYLDLLRDGENVLAIQGLNFGDTSDDFLILPELVAQRAGTPDLSTPLYFTTPTPGAPNGTGVADIGPVLTGVEHTPKEPTVDQPLHVVANVIPGAAGVAGMNLTYRAGSGRNQKTVTIPMFDDGEHGDGAAGDLQFGVDIPAGVTIPGDLVRYNFTVIDGNDASSAWPRANDPLDRELNYGTIIIDPTVVSDLPVLYMFVLSTSGAESEVGSRGAAYYNGIFYDNILVDIHGQSTRGFPKKSFDVDFPRDNRFQPFADSEYNVKDINLLSNYADKSKLRNTLAYETYRDVGAGTHFAFPVRVQQNGKFFGVYDLVEDGDDDYLERNGLDRFGALYKMYNTFHVVNDAEKKTRQEEGNGDLAAFQAGLRQTGAALTRFIYDNVDLPAMANYLAAMTLTGNTDCCHKNYYAYRDTEGTGEWSYLPWDLDLTFGRNWTPARNYFDDGLYSQNPLYIGRGNLLIDAILADPAFNQMYLRRLRSQMDELLQTEAVPEEERHYEKRIDELVALIGDDAALDNAKWGVWGTFPTWDQQVTILREQYLAERRNFLFNMQSGGRGPIPPQQAADVALLIDAVEQAPASGNHDQQFIKLRNPGRGQAIDISGWRIEGSVSHTFKAGTIVPSSGSLYLTRDSKAFRARTTGPGGNQGLFVQDGLEGILPSSGGTIRLVDDAGRLIATFSYEGDPSEVQKHLRISELNYHPADAPAGSPFDANQFEFLELTNTGDTTLDLTGVQLQAGIEFDFADATVQQLARGAHLVIVANETAFRSRYGAGPVVAGMYNGSLSNAGEQIRLVDAEGVAVLEFVYDDGWYPATDGDGATLVIADAAAENTAWGLKAGWKASLQTGGSPGRDDALLLGDADRDGDIDLADMQLVRDQFGRDTAGPGDADFDGDVDLADLNAVRNYFGFAAPTPPQAAAPAAFETESGMRSPVARDAHDAVFSLLFESVSPADRRRRR